MELFKKKQLEICEIRELSVALIYELENGLKKDNLNTILSECTNLSEQDLQTIGVSKAQEN